MPVKYIATDDTISALRNEAALAGDTKMVAMCDRALGGSVRARNEVNKYLRSRRFEQTMTAMREASRGLDK